ncbi:MAG: glycosyltransferase family 4 protein [Candidatus Baldrarchaeia archaeon]
MLIGSSSNVGLTFYYTRLAIAFKRMGIDVVVLSDERKQYPQLPKELKSWNIKQYKDASLHKVNLVSLVKDAKFIRNIIKNEGYFDFILGGGVREGAKLYMSKRMFNSKIMTLSVVGSIPIGRVRQFIARISYGMFYDKCIALSKNGKEQLTDLGLKPDKIWIIPLFAPDLEWFDKVRRLKVNLEIYNLQDVEHPVVFYAASHYFHKGFEYYLMAASEVLKKFDVTFILGGKGPLTQSLIELAEKLRISKHVIFTGWISNYHMPYIQSNVADICVSTSLKETMSSYLLECMAAEKATITTNAGIAPEVIADGKNGFLVPPKDTWKLTEKINWLLEHPKEASNMGINARKTIEEKINMKLAINSLMDYIIINLLNIYED